MVSWSVLGEHGLALALVWGSVVLAGVALLPILRLRIGWIGAPLLGVVYWTLALYVLPFKGGLDVAAAVVAVLASIGLGRFVFQLAKQSPSAPRGSLLRPAMRLLTWPTLILVLGSLPYLSTLFYHYLPQGMDASMHSTGAVLIAGARGLPDTYAPFAPDLAFPPMNLGLPTVAAVAICWGAEPAAAMLACHHVTFTLLILATYLLLRAWVARTPAALLAVVSVWTARSAQASIEWGGFPTVLSVVVGIFAARLLWQQVRGTNGRLALATGAAIAAIPLVHGVGAGTWLYCAAPWITLAALVRTRDRKAMLRGLVVTGLSAGACLLVYRMVGSIDVEAREMKGMQDWQISSAPLGDAPLLGALSYVFRSSGTFIVVVGWLACGVLVLRRQWLAAMLVAGAWLTLVFVVANSRWWLLPASFLLHPDRVIYWIAPISAVALALAWRALSPTPLLSLRATRMTLCLILLAISALQQGQYYQRIARAEFVGADGWEALVWAKHNLQPNRDFVATPYNTTGSYLPAIAQVGCSGAHFHLFMERRVEAMVRRRQITHVLIDQARAPTAELPVGQVVFRNSTVTIVAIGDAAYTSRDQ